MIKITKSVPSPNKLLTDGISATQELKKEYDSSPKDYHGIGSKGASKPNKKLSLGDSNKIYGHSTVKEQLIRDQYEKCAFCESKFTKTATGM